MTTPTEDDELCRMCGNSRQWHREMHPRHPFTSADGSLAFLDNKKKSREDHPSGHVKVLSGLPSDPALRILLLEKGIITQDELNEVEQRIRQAQANGNVIIVTPRTDRIPASGTGDDTGTRDRGSAQGSLWPSDSGTPGMATPATSQ